MLGQHWARSSCDYPTFSDHQKDVLTGILMGDGSIHFGSKNPAIQISMITQDYLQHIDSKLGILSTGVSKEKRTTQSDNEIYRLNTRFLPSLSEFSEWYDGGSKVWPNDIRFNSTVLKHLYVCDGNLDTHASAKRIRISMSNKRQNKEKVESMFSSVGFSVDRWDETERSSGGYKCDAVFNTEQTEKMLNYMGDPLPGFHYKWGEKASLQ